MKVFKHDANGYYQYWVKGKKDGNGKIILPRDYTDKEPPAADEGVRLRFVDGEWIVEEVMEAQKNEYEQKIKAEIRRMAVDNLVGLEEIAVGYI